MFKHRRVVVMRGVENKRGKSDGIAVVTATWTLRRWQER